MLYRDWKQNSRLSCSLCKRKRSVEVRWIFSHFTVAVQFIFIARSSEFCAVFSVCLEEKKSANHLHQANEMKTGSTNIVHLFSEHHACKCFSPNRILSTSLVEWFTLCASPSPLPVEWAFNLVYTSSADVDATADLDQLHHPYLKFSLISGPALPSPARIAR